MMQIVRYGVLAAVLLAAASAVTADSSSPPLAPEEGRILFYRTVKMGKEMQPEVMLNGEIVGVAIPGGWWYVDRPPGDYDVTTPVAKKKVASFHLEAGQTRFIRLQVAMGQMSAQSVYPQLVDDDVGQSDLGKTTYVGKK